MVSFKDLNKKTDLKLAFIDPREWYSPNLLKSLSRLHPTLTSYVYLPGWARIRSSQKKANASIYRRSEYNILNNKEKPCFIDIGQGVLKDHPIANELLTKDIENILKWFKKLGIKTPDFEKVYKEIVEQKV